MSSIAIIDDRPQMREAVRDLIESIVSEFVPPWEVIAGPPLKNIAEYPAWITDHDVSVLVLDERLDDVPGDDGARVEYSGHELARSLRKVAADLPQFIVTSVTNEDDISSEDAGAIEAFISRKDFDKRYAVYVERMVRAGKAYVERRETELAELSRLSGLVVDGGATQADVDKLSAIRAKLDTGSSSESLPALQQLVEEADEIKQALKDALEILKRA